jgi:hypothetical protein
MVAVAEMTSGRAKESQHWYDREGKPVYEVRGANGLLRDCTLRDARKLNLLPGVSSILAMEAKPALERWKIEQALMSALTLPRLKDETDDSFIERARTDSGDQARKAASRGTYIHGIVQGHFEGQAHCLEDAPFVEPMVKWLGQRFGLNDWYAEKSFAHQAGYGGKSDLVSFERPAVIDIKCKDFGTEKQAKDLAWPEHCMQLVAYGDGFGFEKADYINVFISTKIPGLIRVREWGDDEASEAREAFGLLLRLWKLRRKYDGAFTQAKAA